MKTRMMTVFAICMLLCLAVSAAADEIFVPETTSQVKFSEHMEGAGNPLEEFPSVRIGGSVETGIKVIFGSDPYEIYHDPITQISYDYYNENGELKYARTLYGKDMSLTQTSEGYVLELSPGSTLGDLTMMRSFEHSRYMMTVGMQGVKSYYAGYGGTDMSYGYEYDGNGTMIKAKLSPIEVTFVDGVIQSYVYKLIDNTIYYALYFSRDKETYAMYEDDHYNYFWRPSEGWKRAGKISALYRPCDKPEGAVDPATIQPPLILNESEVWPAPGHPSVTDTSAPTATPLPTNSPEPTAEPTEEPTPTPILDIPESAPATVWDDSLGKLITPDNPTYTGFADFEGGKFYIENGQQKTDFVGPVQVNGTFYAFDQGRVQTENMMMAFEGGLFAFNGGTLRTDLTGLAAYDGEQFVFDHGQYQHDACGPYLDPISGEWVYVNYGQFYPITDLVSYDGEIFYFVDGFLATGYTGIVYDFNNTGFYIASGQHYRITDLVSCNGEVLYVVDGKFAPWYTGVVEDFKGTPLNVVNGKVVQ